MRMMKALFLLVFLSLGVDRRSHAQQTPKVIWQVGQANQSGAEFALAPAGFRQFVAHDFGYEDKRFVIGFSKEKTDFPYVLPGPVDTWGGTWSTAGWRTNQVTLVFTLPQAPAATGYQLLIRLVDHAKKFPPLLKVSINGQAKNIQLAAARTAPNQLPPTLTEAVGDTAALSGHLAAATPSLIQVPLGPYVLRQGGNSVTITILEGSWILFDQVQLLGSVATTVQRPHQLVVRSVAPAPYELVAAGRRRQPLLVQVAHLRGTPRLQVRVDKQIVFSEAVEKGTYEFEALLPAVTRPTRSRYELLENGHVIQTGSILRAAQPLQTLADYVDTRVGTAHSRWMIAPGPWMPFSMVKMSPDNQNSGWQAGYEPTRESIGTFSHLHEWTLAGLGVFATNGRLKTIIGDEFRPASGYRSRIDKRTEVAPIGYYKVQLADYDIKAEVTATTRCGFERFTFPANRDSARILLDLHIPAEYEYQLKEVKLTKVSAYRIEGVVHQFSPAVWSHDAAQDYTLHFIVEFDHPIKRLGGWLNKRVQYGDT
ncbi:MAG: hypothetical protein EOO63_07820, partial [Hymenobacter sp.]